MVLMEAPYLSVGYGSIFDFCLGFGLKLGFGFGFRFGLGIGYRLRVNGLACGSSTCECATVACKSSEI